jgi:hypothetical protein
VANISEAPKKSTSAHSTVLRSTSGTIARPAAVDGREDLPGPD